ncbi:cell division protein FtsZ [uncultured Bifidobacterium sp.]|uniref:cell division protein FtsZ n=1 Tax=uncultured Bifidobacterium sp. TaxID=165187 RepID=UPI0028DD00C7|nr:cell division protein FtsZ [uncultured Bifidobacterium sp.]
MSETTQTDQTQNGAQTAIKVVGVGGGGCNAVMRMIDAGVQNIDYVIANTDATDLTKVGGSRVVKVSLSDKDGRGLGAGADPKVGAKAALDHQADIEDALRGADMVFVVCGEGGGTGTGASPLVAHCAREQGSLTIGVVTRPFDFEGSKRMTTALNGIVDLRKEVDALIVIPNDKLSDAGADLPMRESLALADQAIINGVQGVSQLFTNNAYIHVDFSDVKTILKGAGTVLFGVGTAKGEDRAVKAAELAITSPLMEESIEGAHGAIIVIAGPQDLKMSEYRNACKFIADAIDSDALIINGFSTDDSFGDEVRVTVIAAGFDSEPEDKPLDASSDQAEDDGDDDTGTIPVPPQVADPIDQATEEDSTTVDAPSPVSRPLDDETAERDVVSFDEENGRGKVPAPFSFDF